MKVCNTCGRHFQETINFCVFCGTELVNEPAAEPKPIEIVAEEAQPEPVEFVAEEAQPEPVEFVAETAEPEPVELVAEQPAAPVSEEQPCRIVVQEKIVQDPRSLLTTGQYFFLSLLFAFPIIGWIFLFIWGCGKPKNISLKRFSLAFLLWKLIELFLALMVIIGVLALSLHPEVQDFFVKVLP